MKSLKGALLLYLAVFTVFMAVCVALGSLIKLSVWFQGGDISLKVASNAGLLIVMVLLGIVSVALLVSDRLRKLDRHRKEAELATIMEENR